MEQGFVARSNDNSIPKSFGSHQMNSYPKDCPLQRSLYELLKDWSHTKAEVHGCLHGPIMLTKQYRSSKRRTHYVKEKKKGTNIFMWVNGEPL